jgi:hypothetical protein
VPADLGDLIGTHHECALEIGHPPPQPPHGQLPRQPPTMLCSSSVVRSARAIGSSCEMDRCRSRTLSSLVLPVPTGDSSAGSYLRCSCILAWGRDRDDKRDVSYHAAGHRFLTGMARQAIPQDKGLRRPTGVNVLLLSHRDD